MNINILNGKNKFYFLIFVLVIIILGFSIILLYFHAIIEFIITSRVYQVLSSISSATVVPSYYLYDIVLVCQQDVVNVGQSISANITVTNNGEYEGDTQIEWWIEDVYGTNYTSGSTIVNISSGETWTSTKSLLVPSYVSAGIYYYKVRIIAETYSNTVYDTFEVQRPTTTTIPAPSGGGGGGGGLPTTSETSSIEIIEAEKIGSIDFTKSDELGIQTILIETKNTVYNVEIKIEETSKSSEATEAIATEDGKFYKHLKISPTNILNSDITKLVIRFKVEKSWIKENGIDPDKIVLKRYNGKEWDSLPTTKLSEDDNYYYYEAESPGFSIFTIIGQTLSSIEVLYDREFVVLLEVPKVYQIKIKNSGDFVLHNLSVYLQGLESSWYLVEPNKIDLEINDTVTFKINFTVPDSAQIKKYPVNILIKSDELEKTVYLTLNVIEVLEKTEFGNFRESLEQEIINLEKELRELQERGIPADSLYRLLYNAKEKLELAKSEMEVGNLSEASILINEAKFIIDVIKETISEIKPIRMGAFWSIFLIVIIIVALFIVFLVLKIRKESRKRPKLPKIEKW